MTPNDSAARDEVLAVFHEMCEAMVDADTSALSSLLSPHYTLTHMTGYVQPRTEWFNEIERGSMTYHAVADVSVSIEVDGDIATLDARTHTDATIWGSHAIWRLRLETTYVRKSIGWVAEHTVASTW
ncbi:nuclear transport factor 2 family protein [Microbacterium foliorum]|uniref:Nuclear transport factor 2 family protein n=1 Tax=Microbacterium foliorum TaxID=104336 RepID=A0A4Y5YSV2_9MICO|nr:nuclear transport factor 2 family protein [Microbacterium foliorum]QDE35586.1 nuclear transport factor 2 family protein [Microbacterium foliorum]